MAAAGSLATRLEPCRRKPLLNLPVLSSERGVGMSRVGVEVSGCAVGSRTVLLVNERADA